MRTRFSAIGAAFAAGIVVGAVLPPRADTRASAQVSADREEPAAKPAVVVIKGAYAGDLLRVIDGDTFEARVHLWPGLDITTKVRLRGIDAPELKARCAEERSRAEAARDALAALLAEGDLTVRDVGIDKYGGRVLAAAATRLTPDVSTALLHKGVARAYGGGRRDGWCAS